jgi:phage-related protein (TIGR01555 family)
MKAADSLMNFVSGLGTIKDPTTHGRYTLCALSPDQLEAAYRTDWVARKTVNLPADDATREWRDWQADGKQIEAIEGLETIFNLQNRVRLGMIKARLYGGAAVIMGVNQGMSHEELNLDAIKKDALQFVHVLSMEELGTGQLITDIQSPYYGEPEWYETRGTTIVKFHPSRVVRFIGAETPNPKTSGKKGWGDSILQVVDDAIKDVGLVSGSIAAMVNDAKLDIINIPGLVEALSTKEYAEKLLKRFTYANTAKSTINALLLDENEKWNRSTTNFTGMPDILRLYLLIASAAADIPATRMLGQSPAGLSATGESDTRNYYDRISSEQRTVLTPALARLDEVLIRSALGARDPNIHYTWAPLWQMDEKQRAEITKSKAEAFKVDVDAGVVPIEVLRQGRENQLIEDATYPGLDAALEEYKKAQAGAATRRPRRDCQSQRRRAGASVQWCTDRGGQGHRCCRRGEGDAAGDGNPIDPPRFPRHERSHCALNDRSGGGIRGTAQTDAHD